MNNQFVLDFGKYIGHTIDSVYKLDDGPSYLDWIVKTIKNRPKLINAIKEYLETINDIPIGDDKSLPMNVIETPWLHHRPNYAYYEDTGKWMLFFNNHLMNEKWKLATKLFDDNELFGVISLKCSTRFKNPRASDNNTGVIIFYCNDSTDEPFIMNIGQIIMSKLCYKRDMYYKTDNQTHLGTAATGIRGNYSYCLKYQGIINNSIISTIRSTNNEPMGKINSNDNKLTQTIALADGSFRETNNNEQINLCSNVPTTVTNTTKQGDDFQIKFLEFPTRSKINRMLQASIDNVDLRDNIQFAIINSQITCPNLIRNWKQYSKYGFEYTPHFFTMALIHTIFESKLDWKNDDDWQEMLHFIQHLLENSHFCDKCDLSILDTLDDNIIELVLDEISFKMRLNNLLPHDQ